MSTHLKDAHQDEITAMYYGAGWRSVDTMPRQTIVTVLTVRGLERNAQIPEGARWIRRSDKNGPRRIRATHPNGGSWWAIAWKHVAVA